MSGSRGRIFWRVFANSLLLIIIVAAAVTVTTLTLRPELRFRGHPLRLHQVLATELSRHLDDPAELQATLARLAGTLKQSAALYDPQGVLLAAAGDAPPAALSARESQDVRSWQPLSRDKGEWVHVVGLDHGRAYLLIRADETRGMLFLATLAAVLVAVALTSWFMAHRFAQPFQRLTATSRALARGDLSARSGLKRKDEMGELSQRMDEMAARLEESLRSEQELLANISHEIRTPLARLRVALELLEDAPGDARQTLERIQGVSADLTELELLVDNVLINARLDLAAGDAASYAPPRLRPVDLASFFRETAQRFQRHYPGHDLLTNLAPDLPRAELDASLLTRVCDNLLDNAVKYNAPGQPVLLRVSADQRRFRVEVADRGQGVPVEDLGRLFDPFFRSKRTHRQSSGSGLGLSICKRITEVLGGEIQAKLNRDQGMTFVISLPLRQEPALHTS